MLITGVILPIAIGRSPRPLVYIPDLVPHVRRYIQRTTPAAPPPIKKRNEVEREKQGKVERYDIPPPGRARKTIKQLDNEHKY